MEAASQNKTEPTFIRGADISWLPQMEASGYKFYNDNGIEEDCFKILKDHGINDLGENLKDMASRYGKEVMVVEVGGEDNKVQNTYDMLVAVQKKVLEVPDKKGLGVFYWEPEGARSWSHYALSAWGLMEGQPGQWMLLCGCKHTHTPPFCDGTHKKL